MPHLPAVDPLPVPHEALSQSVFLWQIVLPPVPHDPLHVPLSQSVLCEQTALLVPQLPAVEPVPVPHELLSQSLLLWHVVPPVLHAPLQLPLSHWLFCVHALVAELHVPAVDPFPVPHVPPLGQSALVWQ